MMLTATTRLEAQQRYVADRLASTAHDIRVEQFDDREELAGFLSGIAASIEWWIDAPDDDLLDYE